MPPQDAKRNASSGGHGVGRSPARLGDAASESYVAATEFLFRSQEQFRSAYDAASFTHGGVFCATRRKLPEGTPVTVRVRLGRRRPPLVLRGHVAWRRPGRNSEHIRAGLGVAFAPTERPKLAFVLEPGQEAMVKSRRRHERIPVSLQVTWWPEGGNDPIPGTLRDVGRGGAFVRTKHDIQSNTPVVLEVAPPGAAVAMSFAGRVAWIGRAGDDAGFGLEWRARDAGGGRRIKELVRRLASLEPQRHAL